MPAGQCPLSRELCLPQGGGFNRKMLGWVQLQTSGDVKSLFWFFWGFFNYAEKVYLLGC